MLEFATYSDRGGRSANEDSIAWTPGREGELCLVVADGLGGHGGGQVASELAARTIGTGWERQADPEHLRVLVLRAHRAIQTAQSPQCTMKSTVAALAVAGGRAAWAHVGDTRIYHFIQGRLVFQTKDHSASQVAVWLGDITQDQVRFHQDRCRILRALGQEGDVKVETGGEQLEPGIHAFLLCTDGFWEYVLEEEMEETLSRAQGPKDWLERMRARLNQRAPSDCDNNSAAAVWLRQ